MKIIDGGHWYITEYAYVYSNLYKFRDCVRYEDVDHYEDGEGYGNGYGVWIAKSDGEGRGFGVDGWIYQPYRDKGNAFGDGEEGYGNGDGESECIRAGEPQTWYKEIVYEEYEDRA